VLAPPQRFYQRLLARDPEEAEELVDEARTTQPALEICDDMIIPALVLAEQDHQRGALDEETRRYIIEQAGALGDELCDDEESRRAQDRPAPPPDQPRFCVLNLPAADEADEVAARLHARLLALEGIDSRACSATALKGE